VFHRFMQVGYVFAAVTGLLLGWVVTVVNDEAGMAPARSLIVLRDAQPGAQLDRIHSSVAASYGIVPAAAAGAALVAGGIVALCRRRRLPQVRSGGRSSVRLAGPRRRDAW